MKNYIWKILLSISISFNIVLIGSVFIRAWTNTNPGTLDDNLFITTTGALNKTKWNALVNKTTKNFVVASGATYNFNGSTRTDVPGASVTLNSKGGPAVIAGSVGFTYTSSAYYYYRILVDGVPSGELMTTGYYNYSASFNMFESFSTVVKLSPGNHTIKLQVGSTINTVFRSVKASEL